MQKEFEKQEKLKEMDDSHKKEFEQQLHQQEEKHKKHEPVSFLFDFLVCFYCLKLPFLVASSWKQTTT